MDPQLFDVLRDMRKELTDNHVEVVQRLTALEVALPPIESIEKRVRKLEGWRSKLVGGMVACNLLVGTALAYIKRH